MKIYCDECGGNVGSYLVGNPNIGYHGPFVPGKIAFPDVICVHCLPRVKENNLRISKAFNQ